MNTPLLDFHSIIESDGVSIADFRDQEDLLVGGDRRDGKFYRYTPELKLAIRVALVVGRPLLIFGPSGCGKSSLVFNLARVMRRRYYEFVVHSRTESKELFYRFDAIRRLGEAHLGATQAKDGEEPFWRSPYPFIEPGVLWWALAPQSAQQRGHTNPPPPFLKLASDPGWHPPAETDAENSSAPAILLIDEIDKADIDFPNNLLVPLGSRQFSIEESGDIIGFGEGDSLASPLIVITSNRERELPEAFVRRCVVFELQPPSDQDLLELASATYRTSNSESMAEWTEVLRLLRSVRGAETISPAEFVDTIRAIQALSMGDQSRWREIILRTTWSETQSRL